MCLAVPGQLVEWIERESPFAEGVVEFAGVRRRTNLACVPEAVVGDFVLVHAGVAISRIDADEAQRIGIRRALAAPTGDCGSRGGIRRWGTAGWRCLMSSAHKFTYEGVWGFADNP